MLPKQYQFDQPFKDKTQKNPAQFFPNDRPQTPLYLMQQSNADQYKKSLAENLTGYLTSSDGQKDANELNNFLLPKDVNYYFIETEKVNRKVDSFFQSEKTAIESTLDDFLKMIVGIFELKKNELFVLLDNDQRNFTQFYQKFCQNISKFLIDSQDKLDRNMRAFSNFTNNEHEDFSNPLEFQISKIKLQRKQMEQVENAILEIHEDYNRTSINEGKKVLEQMVIDTPSEGILPKKTSVNRSILVNSLDIFVQMLGREIRGLPLSDNIESKQSSRIEIPHLVTSNGPTRMLSPAVWEKLNPDKNMLINNDIKRPPVPFNSQSNGIRGLNRPSSCEPMGNSIMQFNLENSAAIAKKKTVQWLPTISEERKRDDPLKTSLSHTPGPDLTPMKSSNINISINNVPLNQAHYINIYNAQTNQQKELNSVYQKLLPGKPILSNESVESKSKAFRPLSGNLRPSINFNPILRPAKELETSPIITPAVLSVLKTNILSKSNTMAKKFKTSLLFNDYNSKITCFEIEPKERLLILGSSDGCLSFNRLDFKTNSLTHERRLNLNAPILLLAQLKPGLILAATDSNSQNLFAIDTNNASILLTFKTYKERMKLIAFFDASHFLAVTSDDKLLLYDPEKPIPKKSFKIPTSALADICMPSNKIIFTGSLSGDIRIIKLNSETETLAIEGSLKIDHQINSLEVFYNNEKLLLVHAHNSSENLVYIINTQTKKVMNIIKQKLNPNDLFSYITITLYKRAPEIYLVSFGENQVSYCDIDEKTVDKEIEFDGGDSFHLKHDLPAKGKLVKLIGYNNSGQIVAIGLCTLGVISFTFV